MIAPRILAGGAPELRPTTDLARAQALVEEASVLDVAEADRVQVLEFVATHPDAASRTCRTGHLTGSAIVVDPERQQTLLLLHRKLGRWFQPGGHADGDTNLAGVARREAEEETGLVGLRLVVPAIDVDVHRVDPPGEEPHLHLDLRFLVLAPPGSREQGNEESVALQWVGLDGLDALDPPVDESTRRLVARGLATARSLSAGGDLSPRRRESRSRGCR